MADDKPNLLLWQDRIPLLEEIGYYKGFPGGAPGIEYAYVDLGDIYDWLSWPPDPPPNYRGSSPDAWAWRSTSSKVIRIVDTKTGKNCDFQVLERGESLNGSSPGWYRCHCYTVSVLDKLGWKGEKEREVRGLPLEEVA